MLTSIFWAKLLGIYLLIIVFDLLVRKQEAKKAVKDFAESKGLLFYSGSLSILLGLAILISHPIHEMCWKGLITVIGYLLVFRGLLRIAFPSFLHKEVYPVFHRNYWLLVLVLLVLGLYLTNAGFTMPYCPGDY